MTGVRVLLDENTPHKLRLAMTDIDTATVQYMGWGGLKNGELLDRAEAEGFNVLVTGDKALEYQQKIAGRRIAVVALSAPHWRFVKNHIEHIATAIKSARVGSFSRVDVGRFVRTRNLKPPQPS